MAGYEKTREIVQKYDIQLQGEYEKRRKELEELEEIRLPSKPVVYYRQTGEWKGGDDFFGPRIVNYEKTQEVLLKHKVFLKYDVQFGVEYEKRREEIEVLEGIRLPKDPIAYYTLSKEWKGWTAYF